MGQGQSMNDSRIFNEELIQKITYVLTENSKNFSEVSVYRLTQKPFDYYMRFRQTVIDCQGSRQNIAMKREIYRSLEGVRCLVKVEASEIKRVIDLCSNTLEFDSYARYHNYTLENAIDCKIDRQKRFKEADLLYIFENLLKVGDKLNNILGKGYKGLFKAYKIYLSTEGYIKLYPFQLIGIVGTQFIPLQQDITTNSSQHEVEVNLTPKKSGEEERGKNYKDDLRDIALLIIQMILLNKEDDLGSPRKQQLEFYLDRHIGQGLKILLLGIISNKQDFNYQLVNRELQQIKSRQKIRPSCYIRLEQNISLRQSEIIDRQLEEITTHKEKQLKRLSSFHQNLVPARIELLSKKNSFSNCSFN